MSYTSKMEKIQTMERELSALKKELESEQKVEFTIENFRDKKIAVHCKTKEDSNIFLAYLTGKGIGWNSEELAITKSHLWKMNKTETCYAYNYFSNDALRYSDYNYYKQKGFQIIDFSIDIIK